MTQATGHDHGSAEAIPLWYQVPDGFHPIDFSQQPEERLEQAVMELGGIYPAATREQLVGTALSFEVTLARLLDDGAVFFSSFALRTELDELLTGVCQISVVDRPPGDPHLYPLQVLETLGAPEEGAYQGVVELPSGLAAVTIAGHEVVVPGVTFGIEQGSVSRVRTITFRLAMPHTTEAVSVSLATEDMEHDDDYLELATVFAGGVSFTAPVDPPSEEELEAAQRVHEDMRSTFG